MRAIHILVGIIVFASAEATDWDELVQDRGTVAIVQQQAQKDRELEPTGRLDRSTIAALGIDTDSAAAGGSDRVAQGGAK